MAPRPGPDFICVGMPKAGTGWLYDQLLYHPDFWMPPVKELHYLDSPFPLLRSAPDRLRAWRKRNQAEDPKELREGSRRAARAGEKAVAFLKDMKHMSGKQRSMESYIKLFSAKDDKLSGDITPGYADMHEEAIVEVAAAMPETRLVLLVRDPVEREWSQLCMVSRSGKKGGFDPAIADDPHAFRAHLESAPVHGAFLASKTYLRWQELAPNMRLKYFFFDDIAADPEKTRRRIARYIGAPNFDAGELAPDLNRKADRGKIPMPETARNVLVDYLRDEIAACAKLFGGHAVKWAERYGLMATLAWANLVAGDAIEWLGGWLAAVDFA